MRWAVIVAIAVSALGSAVAGAAEAAPLEVVVSFTVLSDLTHEIAGDRVAVKSLVGPDGDVHVYEPTTADVRAVATAQLLILNGLGFEGWMNRLLDSAQFRGTLVIASRGVVPRQLQGHPDPHAWQDPRNAQIYVTNIGAALIRMLPAYGPELNARILQYRQRLTALDDTLRKEFSAIPAERRRVITTHDAFGYFGAAYGIEFLPLQGWTTDAEPSAAALARLVTTARAHRATAVFLENVTDPRMMRQLAHDSGLVMGGQLYSDALASRGRPADTYYGMIRTNADTLLAAMRQSGAGIDATSSH